MSLLFVVFFDSARCHLYICLINTLVISLLYFNVRGQVRISIEIHVLRGFIIL